MEPEPDRSTVPLPFPLPLTKIFGKSSNGNFGMVHDESEYGLDRSVLKPAGGSDEGLETGGLQKRLLSTHLHRFSPASQIFHRPEVSSKTGSTDSADICRGGRPSEAVRTGFDSLLVDDGVATATAATTGRLPLPLPTPLVVEVRVANVAEL